MSRDRLPGEQTRPDVVPLSRVGDERDLLTEHLVARPPVETLGRPVPERDAPVEVDLDDRER